MTEMFGEAWSPMSVPDLAPDDDDTPYSVALDSTITARVVEFCNTYRSKFRRNSTKQSIIRPYTTLFSTITPKNIFFCFYPPFVTNESWFPLVERLIVKESRS